MIPDLVLVNTMGPVSFQSLLSSDAWTREPWCHTPENDGSHFSLAQLFLTVHVALSVCDINLRIERLVVLEHAVDDPQYFVHTDAHGGHVVFAVFLVFFVDLLDQRIAFDRRKGNHIKNVAGLFASLFAHFYTPNTITADFVDRMHTKEGQPIFSRWRNAPRSVFR